MASVAVFVIFYSIRQVTTNKASLTPAISAMVGFIGFGCLIGLINLSHSFHDSVLGGAAQQSSTDARYLQWAAGIPAIKSNPITGHGFGAGGAIIDMGQDSYMLTLVLETGILGLVCLLGCSCFRSGTAYGTISPTCRNLARWPARWLAVLSDSS
jgi:O-antigen ligase